MSKKIWLIDIDGTVCDDIPNETPELFETANVYPDALEQVNKWYDKGDTVPSISINHIFLLILFFVW